MIADATWWIAAAAIVQAICTFGLAVLTVLYVLYTRSLANKAGEQLAQAQKALEDETAGYHRREREKVTRAVLDMWEELSSDAREIRRVKNLELDVSPPTPLHDSQFSLNAWAMRDAALSEETKEAVRKAYSAIAGWNLAVQSIPIADPRQQSSAKGRASNAWDDVKKVVPAAVQQMEADPEFRNLRQQTDKRPLQKQTDRPHSHEAP